MGMRKGWTYQDAEIVLKGFRNGLSDEEIATQSGRTQIRIDLMRQFYTTWSKTGKIWAGNGRIAKLFLEYHKRNNLLIPPEYTSPAKKFSLSPPLSPEQELLRNPYVEFEVKVKEFTQDITKLAKAIARQELNEELKKFMGKFQQRLDSPRRRKI